MQHDVIVIGAGPGGCAAALQAAKLGLDVAVVEKAFRIGGACVHTGTIPSKTLRQTILGLASARRSAQVGLQATLARRLSVQDLMAPKDAVIQHHVDTLRAFLERNQVTVVPGEASLQGPGEVVVSNSAGRQVLRARHVVLAPGSRPRRPASIPFDDRVICDSDSILGLDTVPRSLAVVGGGVIGCEYACMFATLGVRVTLIDRRDRVLRFLDEEIVDALHFLMRKAGVRLLLGESLAEARVREGRRGAHAELELESGRHVNADRVLVAAGRESDIGALGLDKAGVAADERGCITVDDFYRTTEPSIYAVGDVIGFPALAGTSMHQGRVAMLHAAGQPIPTARELPIAVYTVPEVAMVGLTEEACRKQEIPYEVGVARYGETPRGQIVGEVDGMLKLVFRREDHVLVGVHLLGTASSELVHLGMHVLHHGGTVDELAGAVFNYPTLSEAYRVAALDGLNRL